MLKKKLTDEQIHQLAFYVIEHSNNPNLEQALNGVLSKYTKLVDLIQAENDKVK